MNHGISFNQTRTDDGKYIQSDQQRLVPYVCRKRRARQSHDRGVGCGRYFMAEAGHDVRPERFTREFLDASDVFSLTVFDNSYRKMLGYCGTISGRDQDKVKESGLTVAHSGEVPYFEECRMAILCKKLCVTPLKEEDFLGDKEFTQKWYGGDNHADGTGGGYHLLYIAEITDILVKD